MAQTDTQITAAAGKVARRIFEFSKQFAHSDLVQLKAAYQNVDTAMAATGNQIVAGGYGTTPFQQALLAEARKAIPGLTAQEAAWILVFWAAEEAGLTDLI